MFVQTHPWYPSSILLFCRRVQSCPDPQGIRLGVPGLRQHICPQSREPIISQGVSQVIDGCVACFCSSEGSKGSRIVTCWCHKPFSKYSKGFVTPPQRGGIHPTLVPFVHSLMTPWTEEQQRQHRGERRVATGCSHSPKVVRTYKVLDEAVTRLRFPDFHLPYGS